MSPARVQGNVYLHKGVRRPVWRARYRLPDGRRPNKVIGPAWTGRGRPPHGHFTKRSTEDWLRDVLEQARTGALPGVTQTGATFSKACDDYIAHKKSDRRLKPSS